MVVVSPVNCRLRRKLEEDIETDCELGNVA